MSLSDALSEIRSEIKNGTQITDTIIDEIAKDNEVHPNLLRTKMKENNVNSETVLKFVESTTENTQERVRKNFSQLCKMYGVSSSGLFTAYSIKGVKYLVVCRTSSGKRVVVLNLDDLKGYTFSTNGFLRQAKSTSEKFEF